MGISDQASPKNSIEEFPQGNYMLRMHGEFTSRAEAEAAIQQYERAYHPAGYGTRFEEIKEAGGVFIVVGTRGRSCD